MTRMSVLQLFLTLLLVLPCTCFGDGKSRQGEEDPRAEGRGLQSSRSAVNVTGNGPNDVIGGTGDWGVGFDDDGNCGIYLVGPNLQPSSPMFLIVYEALHEREGDVPVWFMDENYSVLSETHDNGSVHEVYFTYEVFGKGRLYILYTIYDLAATVSPYSGVVVNIAPKSVKITLVFETGWNFTTTGNTLVLNVALIPTSNVGQLDPQGSALYGLVLNEAWISTRFLSDAAVDGVTTPLKSLSSSVQGNEVVVSVGFPSFTSAQRCVYDPDFALVITPASEDDNNDFLSTRGGIITVVVVPIVCFFALVLVGTAVIVMSFLAYRKRHLVVTRSRKMSTMLTSAVDRDEIEKDEEEESI